MRSVESVKSLWRSFALILLGVGVAVPGHADSPDELADCAAILDDAERLACFDRVMNRRAGRQAPHEDSPPAPAAVGKPEAKRDPVVPSAPTHAANPEAASGDATASPSSSPADASAEPTAPDMTRERSRADGPNQASTPGELTATVTAVAERAHGRHVVTLDNGQVWEEEFSSRYFPLEPGDTVTIKKRWLSGYRLVSPSGKGFAVERIR